MNIEKEYLINYWKKTKLVKDEKLLKAFKEVRREDFILPEYINQAYADYPLPILCGQTISQPTTIMIMIQALELTKDDKVLEVGAGSGYCAAIMSKLCKEVITTEIIKELVDFARSNLKKAKIKNVKVIHTDGSKGYKAEAPYDKIMVTAACPKIPKPLLEQLKLNGILVAPVGNIFSQKMLKIVKKKHKLMEQNLGDFMFVPLKGEYGFK